MKGPDWEMGGASRTESEASEHVGGPIPNHQVRHPL